MKKYPSKRPVALEMAHASRNPRVSKELLCLSCDRRGTPEVVRGPAQLNRGTPALLKLVGLKMARHWSAPAQVACPHCGSLEGMRGWPSVVFRGHSRISPKYREFGDISFPMPSRRRKGSVRTAPSAVEAVLARMPARWRARVDFRRGRWFVGGQRRWRGRLLGES